MENAMKPLIKDGRIVADEWSLLSHEALDDIDLTPAGPRQIVPLAHYRTHAEVLRTQGHRIAILLGPDDEPDAVAPYLADIALVAIHFPSFTDGRGYSTARLLRVRFNFSAEIRAVGDILRDQLYFLHRCGFDAFSLRADQDVNAALSAFDDYAWAPDFGTLPRTAPKGSLPLRDPAADK